MNKDEYLEARVNERILFYESKIKINGQLSLVVKSGQLILPTSIAIFAGFFHQYPVSNLLIVIFSILLILLNVVSILYRFSEKVNGYKNLLQDILKEKQLYLNSPGFHNENESSLKQFLESYEAITKLHEIYMPNTPLQEESRSAKNESGGGIPPEPVD